MINDQWPKLKFLGGFNNNDNFEAEGKGWSSLVLVEMKDGRHYQVLFEDIERIPIIMKLRREQGVAFIANPQMIILDKVNLKNMKIAVKKLADEGEFGFFTYLKEWDQDKESNFFDKFDKGMLQVKYEYPTVSENNEGNERE